MKRPASTSTITIVLLLTHSLAWQAPGSKNQGNPAKDATPLPVFPYAEGWLGADDAYSVPLADGKSIWLFGDTFVGDPTTKLRSKSKTMVRNSVGISTCVPGKGCSMQYFWRNPRAAKPRSFFDTETDDVWYWPLDGYRDGDVLYLPLMIVRNKPGASPNDVFGFEIAGTKWAKVSNVSAPPEQWKISLRDLTNADLWPGASIVSDGNYVLFYTQVSKGEGKGYMTVLRVLRDKLEDPPASWEYLGKDGTWHAGTPRDDAKNVIDQAISEMTVRYHPEQTVWVAISPGPEFPSPYMVARTAETAVGPWSKPRTIFEFPEMKPRTAGYDRETFCYATKEHVEFEHANLVLTYTCNTMSIPKLMKDMRLYRPQVVVRDVPR